MTVDQEDMNWQRSSSYNINQSQGPIQDTNYQTYEDYKNQDINARPPMFHTHRDRQKKHTRSMLNSNVQEQHDKQVFQSDIGKPRGLIDNSRNRFQSNINANKFWETHKFEDNKQADQNVQIPDYDIYDDTNDYQQDYYGIQNSQNEQPVQKQSYYEQPQQQYSQQNFEQQQNIYTNKQSQYGDQISSYQMKRRRKGKNSKNQSYYTDPNVQRDPQEKYYFDIMKNVNEKRTKNKQKQMEEMANQRIKMSIFEQDPHQHYHEQKQEQEEAQVEQRGTNPLLFEKPKNPPPKRRNQNKRKFEPKNSQKLPQENQINEIDIEKTPEELQKELNYKQHKLQQISQQYEQVKNNPNNITFKQQQTHKYQTDAQRLQEQNKNLYFEENLLKEDLSKSKQALIRAEIQLNALPMKSDINITQKKQVIQQIEEAHKKRQELDDFQQNFDDYIQKKMVKMKKNSQLNKEQYLEEIRIDILNDQGNLINWLNYFINKQQLIL